MNMLISTRVGSRGRTVNPLTLCPSLVRVQPNQPKQIMAHSYNGSTPDFLSGSIGSTPIWASNNAGGWSYQTVAHNH